MRLPLRKPEKCKFIRDHITFKRFQKNLQNDEEIESEDEADEEVIRVVGGAVPMSTEGEMDHPDAEADESEDSDADADGGDSSDDSIDVSDRSTEDCDLDDESDVADLFTTTRYGRHTKTWRASDYM